MEISEEQQIGKKYCSGKSIEWEKPMGISNSQSTERSLYNFVFPNWLDEIVCAAMLAYPHEQRICWSWVRKWTGKRFGERCAESWNLHAGTGRRNSLPATVGSCRSTKMQLAIGWIGGHPAMLIGRFASLRSGACHRKSVGWTLELCASQRIDRETDGDAWIWEAFSPVWRLILPFGVSKRLQDCADSLVDRVTVHQFTSIGLGLTGFLPPLGLATVSNDSSDVFAMVTCHRHKLI